MKLRFQFSAASVQASRDQLVKELEAKGARAVGPLFANQTDPELALLQVLDTRKEKAEELLRHLRASTCVQFAEGEVKRRLV